LVTEPESMTAAPTAGALKAEADGMQATRDRQGSAFRTPLVNFTVDDTRKMRAMQVKALVQNLHFFYGDKQALKDISMPIADRQVTALIGPSGCGKSTFLRCFNRMHDLQQGTRYEGSITLHPDDINLVGKHINPIEVRMRIGMVFQKPNPFPKSIFENVAYGLRLHGTSNRALLAEEVEKALRGAALWDEVKDRLHRIAKNAGRECRRHIVDDRMLRDIAVLIFINEQTTVSSGEHVKPMPRFKHSGGG